MIKCPNCGRTFTDQSYKSHQKSCTSDNPSKGVGGKGSVSNNNQSSPSKNYGGSNNKNYEFEEEAYEEVERAECSICGRKFAVDRLSKHEKVCKKAKIKDDSRPKPKEKPKIVKAEPVASNKWRDQHKEFVESMKYMREVKKREEKGLPLSDLKAPKRKEDSSLIQCPHCLRKFNERFSQILILEAANRHIPICSNVVNKPKSVKQNVGKYTNNTYEEKKTNFSSKRYK